MENCYVIKIGGNIIDDDEALKAFLLAFAAVPGRKILIHGGGKLATRLAEQMGLPQQMVDGRRITDAETLKVVTMVYAGFINKNIVARLQALGCNAAGFSGADGNLLLAHKRVVSGTDYGYAGDIDAANGTALEAWLGQGLQLVIAPITHDGRGQLLNTNADTIAQEIAKACSGSFRVSLIYSFEKTGVLLDVGDEASLIPVLDRKYYAELKKEKKIFAGMIPKLDNAFAALDQGVHRVIIGKGEQLENLITGKTGTTITND
jgi:acetylglutamate kinase